MDFKTLIKNDFLIFDGAFGTEIQKLRSEPFEIPELLNFTDPELIKHITRSYIESGSKLVCTNTFGANRYKLKKHGKTVDEVIEKALALAREAAEGTDTLVALDVSTLGQLLEPTGTLTFEEAYDAYKEIMLAGERYGADVVAVETMTDLYELKAAVLACKENTSLPIICSMTFEKNGRTFTGCSASAMTLTLEGLGADVIGVNCSLGPNDLNEIVKEILSVTELPVMVKPNAGLPDPVTNKFSLSSDDFAAQMKHFAEIGVNILGGCCGTSPEYIRKLSEAIKTVTPDRKAPDITPSVCSSSRVVKIDCPRIIGERINPTGKKLFKEALKDNNLGYILNQAIEQVNAGADILDVNVGLPEIDEKDMMVRVIKSLQGITSLPLQIDSTKPEVIEAALRIYNGKAIVNSVNGEDEILDTILPIIKKYGAAVVGLTLDKNGIPSEATDRYNIACKILDKALEYGIKRENVFIDCLVLTASAEQKNVMETLKAVKMVKEKLGLKTVLGVSNISFGLPNRELINHTFLSMALSYGLDLPILNPNIAAMTGTVRAFKVLSNIDTGSAEFISAYSGASTVQTEKSEITLEYAITNGLKNEAAAITEKLLGIMSPMDIVSEILIPTLDKIGVQFEKGALFLPQLILSAEVSGKSFDVIKRFIEKSGQKQEPKGKIVIATVKGDVHDIGKNIVKVLLENYGYNVIDLGKDVPESLIAETVKNGGIRLCGLSALMTTTLPAMEETIRQIKITSPDCKIMVGGAVLTADYAEKIGADYYADDAKGAVDIAKKVFG